VSRHLIDAFATTGPMAEVFSDRSVLQALLDVETALAHAQAETGMIPAAAAESIARAARAERFDAAAIADASRQSASIVIPLVEALTGRVREIDQAAAGYVHWGATSQDILDTAMSLLVQRGREILSRDHAGLSTALGNLSERHKSDVMLARTLLQPGVPTTFGLKAAVWCHAVRRSWRRLSEATDEAAVLQFGGAGGTLASLDSAGPRVTTALAHQLGLRAPTAPWQADRDRIAALVSGCGLYCGALGKMARDVSLLMQFEVGEAAEPGGGSSSMPHKRNPAGSAIVLATATRLPGLVASSIAALVQEHERAVGGWHAEWATLADALQTTGSALAAARGLVEGLTIDAGRMRVNLEATGGSFALERLTMMVARKHGRERAQEMVRQVLARMRSERLTLAQAVQMTPEVATSLSEHQLRLLPQAEDYLGLAEQFRQRLLEED
jgi:3-carboxy-cis,cis-muconate cycloisomerase